MTGNSDEYVDYILECLENIGDIQVGRMFGGTGLKQDNIQFAMLMGNSLFFVVDEKTRPKYEKRGMGCFWYTTKKGRVNVKKYYEVPAELFEEQDELLAWAKSAIDSARKLYRPKKA